MLKKLNSKNEQYKNVIKNLLHDTEISKQNFKLYNAKFNNVFYDEDGKEDVIFEKDII